MHKSPEHLQDEQAQFELDSIVHAEPPCGVFAAHHWVEQLMAVRFRLRVLRNKNERLTRKSEVTLHSHKTDNNSSSDHNCYFKGLPVVVLFIICNFLDFADLCCFAEVSKALWYALNSPTGKQQ